VALSALACLGVYALTWGSLGFPITPWWWASLAAPLTWLGGLGARRLRWLTAGMYLMVALAGISVTQGAPALGLVAMGLLLLGWDLGWLEITVGRWRGRNKAGRKWLGGAWLEHPGLIRRAAARAAAAVTPGVVLGLTFSELHLSVPFWWLMAGALAAWAGAVALIRAARTAAARSWPAS
jgi:hypothetical protein